MKLSLRLRAHSQEQAVRQPIGSLLSMVVLFTLLAAGCGAPGEPVPPSPPIPVAISDLSAQQAGDGVLLTFTMPGKSVTGDKMKDVPAMEVLHGSLTAAGIADPNAFQVVETVPGAMIASCTTKGKVNLFVPISAAEIRKHAGESAVYGVRARVSDKKTSANSNDVTLKLFPVAASIETLHANLTEQGIDLAWSAPEHTSGGDALQAVTEYHIYRGEIDPASSAAAEKEFSRAVWKMPFMQIAVTKTPAYRDAGFDYGRTYAYAVRSLLSDAPSAPESGDSHVVILTPQDTFPPAAPQSIVAAVLPGATAGKSVVDLSWAINVEADLAGYRVYRSEQQSVRGPAANAELLPTPAFRDDSVEAGKHYWYTVTAVDRVGNESSPSEQIAAEIMPSP